ncbi:MAG TPA: MFS transporter [Caulobacteraceae bacterium]|nr:MFS transporter [Caulobacteraceae bacterium]
MADATTSAGSITRGQITAAVMGNALEFYDFTTYALFSHQIGDSFFPASQSEFAKHLASLMVFAIGFGARPIGAVVLGGAGDRIGRKPAMLLSFALMGLGLLGIVLTPSYAAIGVARPPTYARIGVAAPVLVGLFRMVQGFALGGEVGPTTAFLIEASPPERRGFVGSWQSGSQGAASLVGALIALLVETTLSPAVNTAYGWRIAFGLGTLVLPLGLILRRNLPETLHITDKATEAEPRPPLGKLIAPMLIGLGMIMSFTTSTYVFLYMTNYAIDTLHAGKDAALGAQIANGVCSLVFAVLGGWLSDRFGRKRVMIPARALFLLLTWPAFTLMIAHPDAPTVIGATAVLSALSSASVGVALVALTESLNKGVRSTSLAVIYAVGVAVFGGMVQPNVKVMIEATGSAMAPAWYLIGSAAIGVIAMCFLAETHPARMRDVRAVIETG